MTGEPPGEARWGPPLEESAGRRGLSSFQWLALIGVLAGGAVAFRLEPQRATAVLVLVVAAGFLLMAVWRAALVLLSARPSQPHPAPRDWPSYTVLAAVYDEAEVVPQLIARLARLDYPADRLQGLLLLEAHDHDTLRAALATPRPPWLELFVIPPGTPQTKPRALNHALARATGELLTIYDAEDEPDPQQLRAAAARFAADRDGRLGCLQAPLRIRRLGREGADPFFDRQFAAEYAALFETALPGLARLGLPFPLGGTSNHFRTAALRAVGGWDAWNVTEDADLGFRLAAEGYDLGVLVSPTFEPAPDRLSDWLPQRARWVKGYMQTFGVQTRDPPHWRTGVMAAFALTLGVAILAAFVHAPLLAFSLVGVVAGLWAGESWLAPADVALLAAGWLCAMAAAAVASRRAARGLALSDLLLMPLYWPLHSLAAVHALVQLIRSPHHWDKTRHAARTGQPPA